MELLRQGTQGLAKQGNLGCPYRNLTALGGKHLAGDADNVADIKLFIFFISLIAQLIPFYAELNIAGAVL